MASKRFLLLLPAFEAFQDIKDGLLQAEKGTIEKFQQGGYLSASTHHKVKKLEEKKHRERKKRTFIV